MRTGYLSLQLCFGSYVAAQPTATSNGSSSTSVAASQVTSLELSADDFWNIVIGPVSSANITTTVEATPVPSSSLIPPPFLSSYSFPSGRQVPIVSDNKSWSFPKNFKLGVAGAAFQIEGAARDEGRGPSVWDKLSHNVPGYVSDRQTGDITDNHYYLYKQDIAKLAAIGINAYSFSISWSRIYPFGSGQVNELAIAHYNDVIDTCIHYNITPIATLYHWDTPLFLQEAYGGWLGDQIVPDFVEYARTCFSAFGDRVSNWYTVNEPLVFCAQYPFPAQYFKNFTIPYKQQPYYCGRNVLLAHSQAYRLGKSMMPDSLIAFKNNGGFKIPLTNSSADVDAVQRAWDFNEGWFADPVYLTGNYPSSLNDHISTFLTPFTEEEKNTIKGSADVFAHDAYTSQFYFAPDAGIAACINDTENSLYPGCFNTSYTYGADEGGWLIGTAADPKGATWLHEANYWVPALLHYINNTWQPTDGRIVVSEFGFAEAYEQNKTLLPDILMDSTRSNYYRQYMEAILIALSEGLNIMGCLAWSFVDNLEWSGGLQVKFGMQYVNFSSPTLERHYKASFFQYVDMYKKYLKQD